MQDKWIPVSEKLPPQETMVLVFHGYIEIKMLEKGIFFDGDYHCACPVGQVNDVTHWMPLPKYPE